MFICAVREKPNIGPSILLWPERDKPGVCVCVCVCVLLLTYESPNECCWLLHRAILLILLISPGQKMTIDGEKRQEIKRGIVLKNLF